VLPVHLVTADVNIRRVGKEFDGLVQNVFEKLEGLIRRAIDLFEDAPGFLDLIVVPRLTAKLWISSQRG